MKAPGKQTCYGGETDKQLPNQLAAQLDKFCLTELNQHQSSENGTTQRFPQMSKRYELVDLCVRINIFMSPQIQENSHLPNKLLSLLFSRPYAGSYQYQVAAQPTVKLPAFLCQSAGKISEQNIVHNTASPAELLFYQSILLCIRL